MRRPILGTLFALACVSILVPASIFATPKIGQENNGFSKTEERYLHVYVDCWHSFKEKCGRNIVDDGLDSGKVPTQGRVESSTATMDRWLNPPEPAVASSISSDVAPPTPAPTSVAPTAAGGCVGMEAESGSLGYASPNGGCYQVTPDTAANYDCDLSTPAGQDSCAADICANQGSSAWTNPAGQNPCGRLGG